MMEAIDSSRVREERMRYDVLRAIYRAANRFPCVRVDSRDFWAGMGGWPNGVERLISHLAQRGFITTGEELLGAGQDQGIVACITQRGVDYIQRDARRRRTVR
jgi:hypothetical protein